MTSDEFGQLMLEIRALRDCNIDTKNQLVELTTRFEAVDSERRRNASIDADIRAAYKIAKWVALTVGSAVIIALTAGVLAAVKYLIAA